MTSAIHWMMITGEYPPQPGGVSDHSRLVAEGLAALGDTVQVWAPPAATEDAQSPGVAIHRLPDRFGIRSLAILNRALDALPPNGRLLVQYVPQSFGWDTMNVPFCAWLARAGRRRAIGVIFHEVAVDWAVGFPTARRVRRQFHAGATRLMAWLAIRSARRVFLSIPGWETVLRPLAGGRRLEWLPMPSNVPAATDPVRVAEVRERLQRRTGASRLIGHFGTFSGHTADGLRQIIPVVLRECPAAAFLLVGRGSGAFSEGLASAHPDLSARIVPAGALPPEAVSEHLAACDLLVQPYIDGISTRRSSSMAGLALGVPLLATSGRLTEPFWETSGAVSLAASFEEMSAKAVPLLEDATERERLRTAGATLYRERFHLDRTLAALRSELDWIA